MEFQQKLPQNLKESLIFMGIISILSVNIIAPIITGLQMGFSIPHYLMAVHNMPFIWISVVALVVITQKPAERLSRRFLKQDSSFRSTMLINTICNVLLMSLVLTILCSWIGARNITMEPINHFFIKWPRNYAIALIVEALIAQPLARLAMSLMHRNTISD
ncbi:hypothetical protein M5C72_11500 [Companilactobacillus allii]|uniref:DUF2798 domain-containing protein n=1 Tax=Companilactobacillus allii TaxID=1847728 RepID=A0A1P8Q0M3_9LACO|nr:hypothetical protein [Companilactobacillus allii]APX71375.1 hypothetical protein BTM29_01870 [Companilactobacillus allii]USQ68455.1 hypothetical protein M5C72_11500 [Companilactobacillus allii]